jgi:dephospho-CoA kinase
MNNTIVFPWSFDPWTYGHELLIQDYLSICPGSFIDILIWVNPEKKSTFKDTEKKLLIEKTIPNDIKNKVNVVIYDWLIADYVYENWKIWVLKWARSAKDFEYEKEIAYATTIFSSKVKTIIIPQLDPIQIATSSSSLKAISKFSWDIAWLASPLVREALRMKQSWKFIIWVTGGIASWKSTLCQNLEIYSKNKELPIYNINFDEITKSIHSRNDLPVFQNIRNKLSHIFWKEILNNDWTTNKKLLWDIVFSNKEAMNELMEIMIEPLIHFLRKKVDSIKNDWIILVEWAIIFDRNLTHIFDENIINIYVNKEEQEKRIKSRDNLTKEQISNRLKNQLSTKERISWIIELQSKYKNQDRLFLNIDSNEIKIDELYNNLTKEYIKRKNFKYN